MSRVAPQSRHCDRLPGGLVELARSVGGVVARAKAPRAADRDSPAARDERWGDGAVDLGRVDRTPGDRGCGPASGEDRQTVGRKLRQAPPKQPEAPPPPAT